MIIEKAEGSELRAQSISYFALGTVLFAISISDPALQAV